MPRTGIPRRTPILVFCEGRSEQGYAALLQRYADTDGKDVHIKASVIPSGDPLKRGKEAIAQIERMRTQGDSLPEHRFAMYDADVLVKDPDKRKSVDRDAARAGIQLIRQNVCFEPFLLRHFIGHENDDPATFVDAQ